MQTCAMLKAECDSNNPNDLNPSRPLGAVILEYDGEVCLRARYYQPTTGRFNRLDPFAGSTSDPQSLHKYLYAYANPVIYMDPSGEITALLGTMVHTYLTREFERGLSAGTRFGNRQIRTIVRSLTGRTMWRIYPFTRRPDMVEVFKKDADIYEIKPGPITSVLSPSLFLRESLEAFEQLGDYLMLRYLVPNYNWKQGTSIWPIAKAWPNFKLSPPGTTLMTFNLYSVAPGVILYDFVPTKGATQLALQAVAGGITAALLRQAGISVGATAAVAGRQLGFRAGLGLASMIRLYILEMLAIKAATRQPI